MNDETDDLKSFMFIIVLVIMSLGIIFILNKIYNPLSGQEIKKEFIENIYVQNIKEEHSSDGDGRSIDHYYTGYSYNKQYLQMDCQHCFILFKNDNDVEIKVYVIAMEHKKKLYNYYKFECQHNHYNYLRNSE